MSQGRLYSPLSAFLVLRIVLSVLLAYPVSGAIYAITGIIKAAITNPHQISVTVDLLIITLFVVMVPACAGFIPANEAGTGPRINMYPWIIPTAAVLFFLFSRGWRWFSPRR